jgi:Cys-tRNA(Pro)/Cys-tRNA(Cys) deacylase
VTPAINLLRQKKILHTVHEYEHDATADSFGLEAAEKLGVDPDRMFKTLVVKLDGMAKACGAKKAAMASPQEVERATGYVLGGVSPLGQKKRLKTVIDSTTGLFDTVYVSAGRRGMDIELAPQDLESLLNASLADIAQ